MNNLDAAFFMCGVAMADGIHITHPAEHGVTERAGDKSLRRFNQRDVKVGVKTVQVLGAGGTTETATDNDDSARGSLRFFTGGQWTQRGQDDTATTEELDKLSAVHGVHSSLLLLRAEVFGDEADLFIRVALRMAAHDS